MPRVLPAQRPLVGGHGAVELEEVLILPEGFGKYAVTLAIRFASGDLGLTLSIGHKLDHRPVGLGADPRRGFLTAGDLVGGFPLPLGAHPGEGRLEVLDRQVGLLEPNVQHFKAQGCRTLLRLHGDLVHQPRPLIRQDRVGGDAVGT